MPVRGSLLDSPSQDPDGVTTKGLASHMLVNARFVVGEVLKDGEGGLDRSVGDQLHLDLVHVPLDGVALLSVALVLLVGNLELGVLTGPMALGSATSLLARAPCS